MNDLFETLPFRPADILLPQNCDLGLWSVVACDQYTSQPEYWQRVEERVGRAPSSLRLILPESCLDGPSVETDIMEVNNTMTRYLREERFCTLPASLIYVERRLDNLRLRRGLVGMVDLEQYDYEPGAESLVRATEGTVLSRIPPRVAVRKNAPIELPHVMLLADDPDKTVIEPLADQTEDMTLLYDFDLMEGGGRLRGWELPQQQKEQVAKALTALADPKAFRARYHLKENLPVLLFAVGDGNHSLATAKECYERQKKLTPREQWDSLPARYALCELVNLHDASLEFEPIHRVVMPLARERKAPVIPIDSEHSAIFQCLVGERAPVRRLIVTCSGGAFRDFRAEELANVTVEQALRHPQWDMGAKITIDSSTLVNKGFEVIEAHWLFGTPAERISVLLHPQSIIHSMVEFEDGAIKAQLGTPDMRLPISFALLYPDRANRPGERFNFLNHPQLTFAEVDRAKYPALDIAYDCLRRGGTAACTMNGANEVAVAAFLARKCAWLDIVRAIRYALEHAAFVPSPTLADYAEANAEARALAAEFLQLKN